MRQYIRRKAYAVARRVIPSVRERHRRESERRRLELMVGPPGHWDAIQQYQLQVLTSMGLAPQHTLLDVGCGPLSGGLAFIPHLDAGKYFGIDLEPASIAEAHVQLAKAGLAHKNPYLAVSNTFGREELGDRTFDYIWASQIMYHFDNATMEAFLERIASYMVADSRFYGDIIGYPNEVGPHSYWKQFSFYLHELEYLEEVGRRHGLTMKNVGAIEAFGYPKEIALRTNTLLEFRKA